MKSELWESFLFTLVIGGTAMAIATAYMLLITWLEIFFR